MNIYRVTEDGDACLIRAKSMSSAIRICEESYLEDNTNDFDNNRAAAREYYHEEILQSCELVGQLSS